MDRSFYSWLAVFLLIVSFAPNDIKGLRMNELVIPKHVVRGQAVKLECNFNLDNVGLYSVKWYKDGNEFYRYVPREKPPVLVFSLPGITVDIHNSTENSVVLNSVNLSSSGRYRCEVSGEAPAFQTISDHSDMEVVALPEEGPVVTINNGRGGIGEKGARQRYQVHDVVRFNCTSAKSRPAATLSWFINGEQAQGQYVKVFDDYVKEVDREGLETVTRALQIRIQNFHFRRGSLMKVKCQASIATVYFKSNELSIENSSGMGHNKIPVMESRETRPQGHTHAEHILANSSCKINVRSFVMPMLLLLFVHLTSNTIQKF